MMRPVLLAALAASMVVACAPAPGTSDNFIPAGNGVADRGASQPGTLQQQQSGPARYIAVTRSFVLRVPSDQVAAVQERHLAECARLGCTVLETNLNRSGDGRFSARASVRVAPDRYAAFEAVITAPPGDVSSRSERAEDRTVAVLDIEKRLEVKTTLRDRLNAMLKDPGAKSAADLAAIEKELAQAQGDIEAAIAQRDYLRTITETVRVDITYQGISVVVGSYDFSPIKRAKDGIGQTLINSVASLITFLAAAVPWLPAVALAVWGIRSGLRRWRARRASAGGGTMTGEGGLALGSPDSSLLSLMRAIARADTDGALRMLAASPGLATASLAQGASRQAATQYFLDDIKVHVYAGHTALHVAAAAYQSDLARKLIAMGADVRARNRRGAEPLHAAAVGRPGAPTWDPNAQAATIAVLIAAGADPDAVDVSGVTPLHRAVRTRSAAAVKALLDSGADAQRRNNSGSTPTRLATLNTGRSGSGSAAAKAEQQEIARLLARHGAAP